MQTDIFGVPSHAALSASNLPCKAGFPAIRCASVRTHAGCVLVAQLPNTSSIIAAAVRMADPPSWESQSYHPFDPASIEASRSTPHPTAFASLRSARRPPSPFGGGMEQAETTQLRLAPQPPQRHVSSQCAHAALSLPRRGRVADPGLAPGEVGWGSA